MTRITLDVPPSANKYYRHVDGRVLRSREANEYKQMVGWLCNTAGMTPIDGAVRLTLRVYRKRKQGDTDNYLKVCLDALQGFAYNNDSQIVEIHAYRYDDPSCPRVEVEVEAL